MFFTRLALLLVLAIPVLSSVAAESTALWGVRESGNRDAALIRVNCDKKSLHRIPAYITGKFAEHLGNNIVNGMDAQILLNPTFAEYPRSTGQMSPDGAIKFLSDEEAIARSLRELAFSKGWPRDELDRMIQARSEGLAALWTRIGEPAEVRVSPDTGPNGGRAQRIEFTVRNRGVRQWVYLPAQRTRRFNFELMGRSPDLNSLQVGLRVPGVETHCAMATISGLSSNWGKFTGVLELPAEVPLSAPFEFSIISATPGQAVLRHVFLRPADHINGADPDIIRLLKESHLPILRWPGGNFVSSYHWRDGIGPLEQRPTKPNFAWGDIEPNLFGTDEFVMFCRAVGCEPMICINAGTGTPSEAAEWIKICNGPISSPMGALRAANGHPEPYHIKHWEVGNEVWGKWQYNWTTASGYVDRYRQFASAMMFVDSQIELQACGAPFYWDSAWNRTVLDGLRSDIHAITDHPLVGGDVPASTKPLEVYQDFMAVPEVLEQQWASLRDNMVGLGISNPKLAVTELQLFAHISKAGAGAPQLTSETLVRPPTLAEGIYDVLVYHAAIRLAPFVEMITHSAVVNHGGGLAKIREHVFANPCHYAQAMFSTFAEATPVQTQIETPFSAAPQVLPNLKQLGREQRYGALDALAALDNAGNLLISVVQRSTNVIHTTIELGAFEANDTVEIAALSKEVPWAINTLDSPENVVPTLTKAELKGGKMQIDLAPYGVWRLTFRKK